MKFRFEVPSVNAVLDIVTALAPPSGGSVSLNATNGKLVVTSKSELDLVVAKIPCEVEGSAHFAITLDTFKQAVKGKSAMQGEFLNDQGLVLTSKNYKAVLATSDADSVEYPKIEPDEVLTITPEMGKFLLKAVSKVALSPLGETWIPLSIVSTEKGTTVICYDPYKVLWMKNSKLVGNFRVTLPVTTIKNILSSLSGREITLNLTKQLVEVKAGLVKAAVALPGESTIPLDSVLEIIKKKNTSELNELDKEEVSSFLENAKAIAVGKLSEISAKENVWKVSSDSGSISAKLKNANLTFKMDCTVLSDLVGKSSKVVLMGVNESAYFFSLGDNAFAYGSQNQ